MTTEKPILFNTEMVQAILEGRKTQTRRVMKAQNSHNVGYGYDSFDVLLNTNQIKCPYGKPGGSLWVRETWTVPGFENWKPSEIPQGVNIRYKDDPRATDPEYSSLYKWRPSIFMPRWASRITLQVTNVRVERVQDISNEDAKAEGVNKDYGSGWVSAHSYGHLFLQLWDSINDKRGYSWDSNPWVWVVEFEPSKR